jgi:PPP family 3-phenylpropionic acid transporter
VARSITTGGVRVLYGVYFAFAGVFSPYLSLWLGARGLSVTEMAWLLAVPHATRVFGSPCWGWLADRSGRRVIWLRWSAVVGLMTVAALPWFHNVWALAGLLLVLNIQLTAWMPIGETLALECARGDLARYGRIRLWGSVGFVAMVLCGGVALDALGIRGFPLVLALLMLALAAVAFGLPDAPAQRIVRSTVSLGARLRDPKVLGFFGSAFMMVLAHSALYGFLSLFLEHRGYSRLAIGAIWGLGIVAEIMMFMVQRRCFERWSAMVLLHAAFAAAVLRFASLGVFDGALWVLIFAQCLHALTFALHHSASMALLHAWFEPAQQARAQALYIVIAYGVGASVGGVMAGYLWEHWAPSAIFWGACASACLGWCVLYGLGRASLRHARAHHAGSSN